MTRRAKAYWIIALVLLAGGGAWLVVRQFSARPFEMTTTDPAWAECFRQARLRRGADEQLFDLAGKSVGVANFPAGRQLDNKGIQRQLIIELPADDTLRMGRYVTVSCGRESLAVGYLVDFARRQGGWRAIYDISIQSSYSRNYGLFHADSQIREVDLVVKYWRGPMGKATMTFVGPFEADKPVVAREIPVTRMTATNRPFEGLLKIEGTMQGHWSQVNGYDAKGRRYEPDLLHGYPDYAPGDFLQFHGVKASDLIAVTCVEEPYEVVFKNVPVELPASP